MLKDMRIRKKMTLEQLSKASGVSRVSINRYELGEFYFKGLISEMPKLTIKRGVYVEEWTKVYERNEPLDCSNYSRCAYRSINIDIDAREERLYGSKKIKPADTNGGPKKPKGLISSGIKI